MSSFIIMLTWKVKSVQKSYYFRFESICSKTQDTFSDEKRMLVALLVLGFAILVPSALCMTLYDHRSTTKRLCFQHSIEVADIFQAYEVLCFRSEQVSKKLLS